LEKDEYMRIVLEAGFQNANIISEKKYPMPEGASFPIVSITVKAIKPVDTVIRPATESDYSAITALLTDAKLPREGVREHLATFLVAEDTGTVVGAAGLELYGETALLRSVVVANNLRNSGMGAVLYNDITRLAKELHAKQFVLLTTTADKYFERKGFVRIDRSTLTGPVTQSIEFTSACPSSAICMKKEL
jgi:amino-acid N-acetyltransferase